MSVVPDEILVATGKQIIKQEDLDLDSKTRTSLFPWRGQFSPQLVEVLLNAYAHTDSVILDPFAGSGTTLFESARKKLACYAAEINPSAVEMANTAHFTNLSSLQRSEKLQQAQEIFKERFGDIQSLLYLESENKVTSSNIELSLTTCVESVAEDSFLRNVFVNTLIRYRNQKKKGVEALLRSFQEHCRLIEQLPYNDKPCQLFHTDARKLPLPDACVDLVITSPPYINVFNYHQNNRPAMELLGWNLLTVAKSEIGSNRKNRQNRFLTVVQYALDIHDVLEELHRVLKSSGMIVMIVGKESSVRGVSFKNGKLVAALATSSSKFYLENLQERKFKNKFGELIYEDILYLKPLSIYRASSSDIARSIAVQTLLEAIGYAKDFQVRSEIIDAKKRAVSVKKSPLFELRSNQVSSMFPMPRTKKIHPDYIID